MDADEPGAFARSRARTDSFRHRDRYLIVVIGMLAALLALVAAAALAGPGFDPGSSDPLWTLLAVLFLAGLIGAFGWALWRRPVALRIGPAGLDLPMTFARPLPWAQIHRIRRLRPERRLEGRRDWLVVDPAPGILPDYRLPTWRWAELRFHRWQKLRIPLHALEAEPDVVVASIERFRPVTRD